MNFYYIYFI